MITKKKQLPSEATNVSNAVVKIPMTKLFFIMIMFQHNLADANTQCLLMV